MKSQLTTWDPFKEFENLRGISKFLGNLSREGEDTSSLSNWAPAVDIAEDDTAFHIKADLPDVNKEDVKVSFDQGMLTISGERKFERVENDKKKYHRIERSYGHYSRSFRLPETVAVDQLTAEFKDGVLSINLPKREDQKPRQIEIKVK
jgi:HSP20 family protein